MRYPLADQTIPQADLDALADWLRGGPWLTFGTLCREFEERFAAWLGRQHAIFVNSGSSANLLMVYAAKLCERLPAKIRAPALAWATTLSPFRQLGIAVELRDADPNDWGLDRYDDNAVHMVVHVLGVPAYYWQQGRYVVLEDACAGLGSIVGDRKVGTYGQMSTFSFYYGHQMSTIEGGMVVTDDDELADCLRALREHGAGWNVSESARQTWEAASPWDFTKRFTFQYPGFNMRPTEIQGFLGLRQMERIDEVSAHRAENDARYRKNLEGMPFLACQIPPVGSTVASIAVGVLAASAEHRAKIAHALELAGIETRPIGTGNVTRQPFWPAWDRREFPMADAVMDRGFQLPNHPGLTPTDIDFICETVLKVKP